MKYLRANIIFMFFLSGLDLECSERTGSSGSWGFRNDNGFGKFSPSCSLAALARVKDANLPLRIFFLASTLTGQIY